MPTMTFNVTNADSETKLGELIVYVAQKCAGDASFGATKLNKILYYADFLSYFKTGKAITGVTYMKLPNGPAPKRLVPVRNRLEEDKAIERVEMIYHGYRQNRVIAKRKPILTYFTADDIAQVDEVIECLSGVNAKTVSRISHNIAWEIAGAQGEIPYESVFLSDDLPSDGDVAWALGLKKEHGWNV
jgi:hypothetical protein